MPVQHSSCSETPTVFALSSSGESWAIALLSVIGTPRPPVLGTGTALGRECCQQCSGRGGLGCAAPGIGWKCGRRRDNERRGDKGNRKQSTREKNTQPQRCSWHQRSLKPQSPATPRHGGTALCPAWCQLLSVVPSELHQHCESRGQCYEPRAGKEQGYDGGIPQSCSNIPRMPREWFRGTERGGTSLSTLSTLCNESASPHRTTLRAPELSSLPLLQFPPPLLYPPRAVGEGDAQTEMPAKIQPGGKMHENSGTDGPGHGSSPLCRCHGSVHMPAFPFVLSCHAWEQRGAAGATLADSFKMSQCEPKSGWHPVFNPTAGWHAGWLRAAPHPSQHRRRPRMPTRAPSSARQDASPPA